MSHITKWYGPPGTGKTTKLMSVVQEIVTGGTPLHEIGYLSFSRAAANVIKDRMGAKDQDVRWFRTLHGAACKQLGLGSAIIDWKDYKEFSAITRMMISPDDGTEEYNVEKGIDFNICKRAWDMSLTTLEPLSKVVRALPDHPNLQPTRLNNFIEAWVKFKADRKKFDFMDMLTMYDREGLPLPIRKACGDEMQDLSPLQWRVFHKMTANCDEVHMAADDDQNIFGFIGASPDGFLDHPCDEEHVLPKSWRVPENIGGFADKVIRKVPHRKEKNVEWKPEPGSVKAVNIDPLNMPWARWLSEYHNDEGTSIMVLTRHRKGASKFATDLKLAGIAHSFQGETMNSWPEAKVLHSLYSLREGKTITPRSAVMLAEAFGKPTEQYRRMGVRDKVSEMPGIDLKGAAWLGTNSSSRRTRERFNSLLNLVRRQGYEKLAADPKIVVQTMHSSKGDEANLVIVVPDCTNVVKRNCETATEIRLAYVALTRAKRDVAVLVPRTDTYIQHFLGG